MTDDGNGVPSRAARSRQVERRWRVQAIVAVVLIALLIGIALIASGGGEPGASATPSATTAPSVATGPTQLLAFAVTGSPNALLATIGTGGGRESAAVVLPPDMTVVMPGAGEMSSEQLRDLDGPSMQIGVSNVDGAWNDHYAIMDLDRLGALVDRMGGLNADLGDLYPSGDEIFGPGEVHMTGEQVIALLRESADDTAARWADVLRALLAGQPNLSPTDLSDADDAAAAADILGAGPARIEIMPTQTLVGASTTIPAQPDLDQLMSELYDTETPARAEVRNGNGEPGVGSSVGALLIPAGFRVVLSDNADTFDHQTTQVIADGPENEQVAADAKEALGVGKLIVSQVPSGVADVTVIVGHDFHA